MVSYSEDNMVQHFSKYKNNELNIWFLKNPIKLNHKENSDLTFNIFHDNEKTKKTFKTDLNTDLNVKFKELIEKI